MDCGDWQAIGSITDISYDIYYGYYLLTMINILQNKFNSLTDSFMKWFLQLIFRTSLHQLLWIEDNLTVPSDAIRASVAHAHGLSNAESRMNNCNVVQASAATFLALISSTRVFEGVPAPNAIQLAIRWRDAVSLYRTQTTNTYTNVSSLCPVGLLLLLLLSIERLYGKLSGM